MRRIAQRWASAGVAVPLLLLIGGCGLSTAAVSTGQSGAPTASATKVATTVATGAATMTATPTQGAVTLRLGQTHAGVSDAVSVTITNNLRLAILVEDHQSGCTVVTLERQEGGGWVAVALCRLETPTRTLPIPSGTTQTVKLSPGGGSQPPSWQAGTYRFALRYSTSAGTSAQETVYSQTFTIG